MYLGELRILSIDRQHEQKSFPRRGLQSGFEISRFQMTCQELIDSNNTSVLTRHFKGLRKLILNATCRVWSAEQLSPNRLITACCCSRKQALSQISGRLDLQYHRSNSSSDAISCLMVSDNAKEKSEKSGCSGPTALIILILSTCAHGRTKPCARSKLMTSY